MCNSHAKPDEIAPESAKSATVNGNARSPSPVSPKDSRNRQAFAANSSIPVQTPSNPAAKQEATEDVEMSSANGTTVSEQRQPSPTTVLEKKDATGSPEDKAPSSEAPVAAKDEDAKKPNSASDPAAGDKMDIDVSNEASDPTLSAEQPSGTQDTKATTQDTDAPASTPKEPRDSSQQPTNESKSNPNTENDELSKERATSPTKVSRMREDDNPDEPASKRPKIDDPATPVADSLVVASGPSPASQAASNLSNEGAPDDQVITPFQNKMIRSLLAGLKKTKNGQPFRHSVEKLWPQVWNDYKQKVEEPVDISLFEARLREEKYANYGELKAHARLLFTNAVSFNGLDHTIAGSGAVIRDQILAKLAEIAKMQEPAKPEKGKAQPTRHTEPRSATQVRRQSQSQANQTAASPKPPKPEAAPAAGPIVSAASTAPAFAIPPNGIPQIRRDSTREDGDRPKRPIHPPKNRDLDYSSKANRKKKLDPEQRFHDDVLTEIKKGKYFHMNQWFMEPVDPVALNIPTYFSIVKKPMDLGSMTRKNLEGHYKSSKEIEKDMRLIVHNAELFNGKEHDVAKLGRELEELFKTELGKKDQWMAHHYPQDEPSATNASAASPERSLHESEEESEPGGEEETNEAIRNLQVRLNEEQEKLNVWLGSKKPDLTMIEIQQQMVSMLQRKLVEEKTKLHSEARKPKAKKKASKSKPKASGNAATSGAGKKGSAGNTSASKKSSGGGSKKSAPKKRTIGQLEKAVIEEGIGNLDGNTLTKAVDIIKKDTGQNVSSRNPVFFPASCCARNLSQHRICYSLVWVSVVLECQLILRHRKMTMVRWSWT